MGSPPPLTFFTNVGACHRSGWRFISYIQLNDFMSSKGVSRDIEQKLDVTRLMMWSSCTLQSLAGLVSPPPQLLAGLVTPPPQLLALVDLL